MQSKVDVYLIEMSRKCHIFAYYDVFNETHQVYFGKKCVCIKFK